MKRAKLAAFVAIALGVILMKQDSAPRGVRNNNPLNIRVGNDWQGERAVNDDGEFEQFESVEMGFRAAAKLLKNYRDLYGADTIEKIIARWAPSNENNTAAYIASVEKQTGISRATVLSDSDYVPLIAAMVKHENGVQPYSLVEIENGFKVGFYA